MIDIILNHIIELLFVFLTTFFGIAYRGLLKKINEQNAVSQGVKALLWDRIYTIYHDKINEGFITVDELKNIERLYRQYHNLGGNGTGTEIYEKLKTLPNIDYGEYYNE